MEDAAGGAYSDAQIARAVEALSDPERFREAESFVARAAPSLQGILAEALAAGGWFDESHREQVLRAATTPDSDERIANVRTLLAEETRIGMLVGVAVGWGIAEELRKQDDNQEKE